MFAQPAFEIKTYSSPVAMIHLFRRLQAFADGVHTQRYWWQRRRVRSTLTARQMQQRIALQQANLAIHPVWMDLMPRPTHKATRVRG